MEIGQFTKDVTHISGLKNTGSDFLSRIPVELKGSVYSDDANGINRSANVASTTSVVNIAALEGHKLKALSPAVVAESQNKCKEIVSIKAGKHPTSVIFHQVKFGDEELLCEMSLSRPFLPKELRSFVMRQSTMLIRV